MKNNKFIFSFGCPRSGTTFFEKYLSRFPVNYQKITEASKIHPWRSSVGLFKLVHALNTYDILLIRSIRHPADILDSFYASINIKDFKSTNISKNSFKKICEYIVNETYNFNILRNTINNYFYNDAIKTNNKVSIIEIKYEDLYKKQIRQNIKNTVVKFINKDISKDIIDGIDQFGKKPSREGKLSHKVSNKIFTPHEILKEFERDSDILKVYEINGYKPRL